jgi:hypothetical protein
LGRPSLETGHKRLPTPPDKITGTSMFYILTPKQGDP